MSCPSGCYKQTPGLRIRLVPELHGYSGTASIVFTPAAARLWNLNEISTFVLALCDGKSPRELEAAYLEEVVPPLTFDIARRYLELAIRDLEANRIIEFVDAI